MRYSDFCLVFQGPQNENINRMLEQHYRKEGVKIVVSNWEDYDYLVDKKYSDYIKRVSVSKKIRDEEAADVGSFANLEKQARTTLEGCLATDRKYIIKIRGDEFYEHIDSFISKFLEDTECIVTNNVFARKFSDRRYHASDHFFICKREHLISGLVFLLEQIKDGFSIDKSLSTEGKLFYSLLLQKGDIKEPKEAQKRFIKVLSIKEHKNFVVHYNNRKRKYEAEHHSFLPLSNVDDFYE